MKASIEKLAVGYIVTLTVVKARKKVKESPEHQADAIGYALFPMFRSSEEQAPKNITVSKQFANIEDAVGFMACAMRPEFEHEIVEEEASS